MTLETPTAGMWALKEEEIANIGSFSGISLCASHARFYQGLCFCLGVALGLEIQQNVKQESKKMKIQSITNG